MSARLDDVVLEALSAKVHMWKEIQQQGIIRQCSMDFDTVVWISGRDQETIVRQLQGQHSFVRRFFLKDHTDARLVLHRMSVSCVVHLQYDVRSGGDQFGEAFRPLIRQTARRVDK